MKSICRNCHFLAKEYRVGDTGHPFSLDKAERFTVKSDPTHAVQNYYLLKCQLGIWDEGVIGSAENRDILVNKTKRKNACFFFPYHREMLFQTAKELQVRKCSGIYTRIGLWISAVGLVVKIIATYLKG